MKELEKIKKMRKFDLQDIESREIIMTKRERQHNFTRGLKEY